MLTYTDLRKSLGVSKQRLDRWLREGLPFVLEKKQKKFDPLEVRKWLITNKKVQQPQAPPATSKQIATTRGEAARLLGVSTRTFAEWIKSEGFPGQPGAPGRQDGVFPIEEIQAWRQARFGGDGRSSSDDEKLREARYRKLAIQTDREQVEFEKDLGYILDAQEMADFLARHASMTKAMLEQMADKVETRLPENLPAAIRAKIRAAINETLDSVLHLISEMAEKDAHKIDDAI